MRHIEKDSTRVPATYTSELLSHHYDSASLLAGAEPDKTGPQIFNEISHNWPSYKEMRKVLFKEQGWVCAYCGRRVPDISLSPQYSTEHIKPKSVHREYAGEYTNLVISCQGNRTASMLTPSTETGKARLHCDAHKEHKEISISPLDPNCGSHFTYDHMGRISAEPTDADALKTIAVLNLKERALTKERENAIDAYLWDVSTSDFVSDEELKMTRTFLEQKDANGRYEPFYFVIIDVIDQFLGNKI